MPSGRPTSAQIPVNHRKSNINVTTVATFTHDNRRQMYAYIKQMNELNIGHFYIARVPTLDWDEEALIQSLMQPIDEATTASLSALECESNSTSEGTAQCRPSGEKLGQGISFNQTR